MADRQAGKGRGARRASEEKRRERADRILDAAAELMQRWGYSKTTIDDIARQAGVAKGTIYLHWKTREELFMALMVRETIKMGDEIRQRIAADPQGSTLAAWAKHVTLATLKRPIMKALMTRDTDLLGELAHGTFGEATYETQMQNYRTLFETLRNQGQIRTDIDIDRLIFMLSAIITGYLFIGPMMPPEFSLYSDEELVEMLAETVSRTFEPHERPEQAHAMAETGEAMEQFFEKSWDELKRYQKELEQ